VNSNEFRLEPEITELARLIPVPGERDLPAGRQQILKEHLMTELGRPGPVSGPAIPDRRKSQRRLVAVAGAGVVAIAVAATAIVAGHSLSAGSKPPPQSGGPVGGPVPGGTTPAAHHPPAPFRLPADRRHDPAARLLAKIANAAGSGPVPVVRDSEFMYIRSKVAYEDDTITNGHETATMAKLHERQIWLPVANICVTGRLTEHGSSMPISPFGVTNGKVDGPSPNSSVTCPSEGTVGDPSYRLLQSLPVNPNALLRYLRRDGKKINVDPAEAIGDLIRETIVPPSAAAALYRAAALLPGATVAPGATNAVGRHGIGIVWPTGGPPSAGNCIEWIFDEHTLQYIGERDFNVKTGEVSGKSAILRRGFVSKLGQLPVRPLR
jgi:hypothetical protein